MRAMKGQYWCQAPEKDCKCLPSVSQQSRWAQGHKECLVKLEAPYLSRHQLRGR